MKQEFFKEIIGISFMVLLLSPFMLPDNVVYVKKL
ncbi:MAG: hypothetical protein RL311_153 [Bacteroidota bacterium]|jgi:hypothetical protein